MSELIILKVQEYLNSLNQGQGESPEVNYEDFGPMASDILAKVLEPEAIRKFRIRMSNIGRPGCILQAEKLGHERDPEPYASRFRNAYGDIVELLAVSVMEKAGVNIVDKQRKVSKEIAGQMIAGTYDLIIAEPDAKMYDLKSASGYLFKHKYQDRTLVDLWKEGDGFGYVTQLYCYAEAKEIPVGGLIVVSKETGEWCLVPPPQDDKMLRLEALNRAYRNTVRLTGDAPFAKDFSDMPEVYKKKPTGNRILGQACSFCPYRKSCWPTAKYKPQVVSKGKTPRWLWYTHINKNFEKGKDDEGDE